jgi:hypothetical protein
MQTILSQTGQFILQQSEVLAALGIPATAQLQSVTVNADGTVVFVAQQQVSNTGSP